MCFLCLSEREKQNPYLHFLGGRRGTKAVVPEPQIRKVEPRDIAEQFFFLSSSCGWATSSRNGQASNTGAVFSVPPPSLSLGLVSPPIVTLLVELHLYQAEVGATARDYVIICIRLWGPFIQP